DDGAVYTNPLQQNVVGGPDPQFSPAITNGRIVTDETGERFQADTPLGSIDLPYQLGGFELPPIGTQTPFGPIAGFGAGGPNFAGYAGVQVENSVGKRVFLIAGEPTADGGNLPSPTLQLSTYEVVPDPVYQADVPFIPDDVASHFEVPAVSDLYILRRAAEGLQGMEDSGRIADNSSPVKSRFLIAAGAIEGEGANQKSFLLGAEGSLLTTDDGKLAVSIGSQGSFRLTATEGPARQTGSLGTISDGEGEPFFGPDLNFFALTTSGPRLLDSDPDVDIGSASFEPYASSSTAGEVYSYAHLVNQTAADAPIGSRSARVLTGYAAVLGETRLSGDRFEAPYVLTSHDPGGVVVAMEPTTNSLAAVFQLDQNFVSSGSSNGPNYVSDVDTATFGFGGVGEHVGTYIDDDRYAARNTRNPDLYGNINGRQGLS